MRITLYTHLFFLTVLCSGCFRMGMPEYFSEGSVSTTHALSKLESPYVKRLLTAGHDSRAHSVLVVLPEKNFTTRNDSASFGHQYLLGIFPLTRLYFEHSPEVFVTELLNDELQARGFTVYETTEKNRSLAESKLQPSLTLRPKLNNFRVNAFDVFFFRIIATHGEIALSVLESDGKVREDIITSFSEREPKKSGHAPILTAFVTTTIKPALNTAVKKALRYTKQRRRQGTEAERDSSPLVVIPPPSLTGLSDENFSTLLAQSYGFQSVPPFSPGAIGRLVQRGFMASLIARDLSAATTSVMKGAPQEEELWNFSSEIVFPRDVVQNSALALGGHLKLTAQAARPLFSAACSVKEGIANESDGALVVTLERASESLARKFFEGHDSPATLTEQTSFVPSCQTETAP